MAVTVIVRQHDAPVAVSEGETILEAALQQGVPYPHGCRSGNCGACKSRLESGDVDLAVYSEFALSEEERAQGLILACRAMPWSDAVVSWLDSDEVVLHPERRLACRVVGVDAVTHDIRVVRLAIESGGPFTFSAGQYASLRFADLPARDYSMANRADESVLEFHIRRMGPGSVSAHVTERLRAGDTVTVQGPLGTSYLRDKHTGPIIAIAGGSGLAPIKSIIDTALHQGLRQPMRLYFGARDERDIYLEDHFRTLAAQHPNFRFIPVLSAPSRASARRVGFVHEAAAADLADLDGAKAYLAGPPPMVEAGTALLLARGVRRSDIHADAFYTEAEKQALAAKAPLAEAAQ
ncbi:MAG TPA: 2Fe-2S iron-sulfur cluster-binding protein [Stellaceae bacterium]|nr:2Fe-2S iron-sulfur cluster-binding protein [Stellaceae bacterium]